MILNMGPKEAFGIIRSTMTLLGKTMAKNSLCTINIWKLAHNDITIGIQTIYFYKLLSKSINLQIKLQSTSVTIRLETLIVI